MFYLFTPLGVHIDLKENNYHNVIRLSALQQSVSLEEHQLGIAASLYFPIVDGYVMDSCLHGDGAFVQGSFSLLGIVRFTLKGYSVKKDLDIG